MSDSVIKTIKEDLQAEFECYGIDAKGKLDDIAQSLATTFEMINELDSYGHDITIPKIQKVRSEDEVIGDFLKLPLCHRCGGVGYKDTLAHDKETCDLCRGYGRLKTNRSH